MLTEDDLETAVRHGIVTQAQVDALRAFAVNRSAESAAERADDERFRFMRGFNDIFFAVGVALLGVGLGFFASAFPLGNLVAAVVVWALAELLVRRMRLVLSGILLAGFFVFFVFRTVEIDWTWNLLVQHTGLTVPLPMQRMQYGAFWGIIEPATLVLRFLVAGLAATLFYARFRLPFALLLVAGSCVGIVAMALEPLLANLPAGRSLILLACGIGVFLAAMRYDLSDRERVTRRSDCAFWLHLLAAPLIVHSLIQMISPAPDRFGRALSMTTDTAVGILAIFTALTIVAIVIDRRALLVSALAYLGSVIAQALTATLRTGTGDQAIIFFTTVLILGTLVLVLGLGWQPLRRLMLSLFPTAFVARLPRAASAA